MYLLWRAGGPTAQDELWDFLADDLVRLYQPQDGDWQRVRELMQEYGDVPMDLADASLVVAAEQLGIRRIFALDGHFYAYRIGGKHFFEVLP
jgi:predicted nucleic acid-binding protein